MYLDVSIIKLEPLVLNEICYPLFFINETTK